MVKNENGYSFQPDLFNKMYEDKKEDKKKKEREKKSAEKKKEREKKQKERKKNKPKKKKKLTQNEKIMYTIFLVISIPLSVLFFIYYNSSLMQTILLARGLFKTEKNLGLPTDPDKIPYAKSKIPSADNHSSNNQSVFDLMDKQNKKVSGVSPPKKQTGGRKMQKGGNKFNKSLNEAKEFLDPTKFGFPYTWYDNDNFFMRGVSDYFVTFWTFMRGSLVKLLDMTRETFYSEYQGHPSDLGGQVFDFIKFTAILPMLTTLMYVGNYVMGSVALVWSSINNQTLLILFWLTVGLLLIIGGTVSAIAAGGIAFSMSNIFVAIATVLILIPLCYMFPYGFFWFYLQALILKITDKKKKLFRNYLKNYELCWILSIIILLGGSVSYVWEWHIIPMVAFGGVGGTFILLRAMGLI